MHERDDDNKYDSQEDGEYHFSDDQMGYDEPEVKVATAAAAPQSSPAAAAAAGVSQYRRPIIGVAIFILLIFLVYKISAPTTTQPATDFAQNSGAITNQNPGMKQPANQVQTAQAAPTTFQPLAPANGMSGGSAAGTPIAAPVAPVQTAPVQQAPVVATSAPPIPVPEQVAPVQTAAMPAPPATGNPVAAAESYYNPMHPNSEPASGGETSPSDQLVALQKENARLTADFTQKMADAQAKNDELQNKLEDLNMRLASMESTIARIGRSVQETKQPAKEAATPATVASNAYAPPRNIGPHSTYSVQAIIPGRAWLKSDDGETITVAEGDTLKNYGRIMKIDPYDGIVQIDTGGRIMSLSYGVSTD
jgi:hypothetical protein